MNSLLSLSRRAHADVHVLMCMLCMLCMVASWHPGEPAVAPPGARSAARLLARRRLRRRGAGGHRAADVAVDQRHAKGLDLDREQAVARAALDVPQPGLEGHV